MAGFHLRYCIGWLCICLFPLGADDSRPNSNKSGREAMYGSDQTWTDTEGFEAVDRLSRVIIPRADP